MWLISFVEKHKILSIFISISSLFFVYFLSKVWSSKPIQIDVAIDLTIVGCVLGSIVYLLIKYVFKIHEGEAWHYIYLSWIDFILFVGVIMIQIFTKFSLDIPTEAVFALPGLIIIPNGHIYKVVKGAYGTKV